MTKEKEEELSRLATSKAYDAYPISKTNMCNNELNAKRVGFQQGYNKALIDFFEIMAEDTDTIISKLKEKEEK